MLAPDRRYGRALRCTAAAAMLCLAAPAHAQESASIPDETTVRRGEFDSVTQEITLSKERIDRLAAEIATVKRDSASLTAALIQAAKTDRKLSEDVEEIGTKLEEARAREATVRTSLASRSAVLAEVLAALQRMGLNPPPAILIEPEDALASVRSAILLGSVVPELREQTEILLADMAELQRAIASVQAERDRLTAALTNQAEEKRRLSMLLDVKAKVQAESEAALAEERRRAAELAERAESLKDLIAVLEEQAAERRAEAEAARAAKEAAANREAEIAALPENNRELAASPFAARLKRLTLPVTGRLRFRFGDRDDNGGVMHGDTVATQSGAIVTAPADGNVLYAGPFRSYGQLLILDAGDGYHIVLAGMSRINVALGRSVLAGEPVGAMGEARLASLTTATTGSPELYVEFRKDGKPVDPAPWWAERRSGRTGNDT